MTHPNSQAAHATLTGDRRAAVLECYRQHGPLTDRAVAQMLFGQNADPNTARPRITELVKAGELDQVDNVADNVTGHTVRRCGLRVRKPFCNCTFANKLQPRRDMKPAGIYCHSEVHPKPLYYGPILT